MKREYKDGKLVKPGKPDMPIMSDHGAMLSIVNQLDGKEWDTEILETIAEFCRLAGYEIRLPMTWHNCPNCGGHQEDEAI